MLYILSGPDDFSRGEYLVGIKKDLGDESLLATNTTTLDGQQVTTQELKAVTETVPFLAQKRLVVVTGLLERFGPRSKSSRRKEDARAADRQSEHKLFSRTLSELHDSTVVVLIDSEVKRENPLFKALSPGAKVRTFPWLRGDRLVKWVKERAVKEGGDISPRAAALLARLVGSNLWVMASELEKLALFTSGHLIGEEDVKRVVGYAQQANVFAMVDAILEFKVKLAERHLAQLLAAGLAPSYLLFMLVRQVRLVLRARELKRWGRTERDIQATLGLGSDFVLRKTLGQAARYSLERLKEIYEKLLETDLAIKTGRCDGDLALNILAAELCESCSLSSEI